jgi:hypothetical protein
LIFPPEPYQVPRWLYGGHAQTIYPALLLRGKAATPVLPAVRFPAISAGCRSACSRFSANILDPCGKMVHLHPARLETA